MNTYTIVRSDGSTIRLQADRVETPDVTRVIFYIGEDVVASFAGFSAFFLENAPAQAQAAPRKVADPTKKTV